MSTNSFPTHKSRTVAERGARIAVVIPCYNEEVAIGGVVREFHAQLPTAEIHVFDNNSSDRTVEVARAAGAHVSHERRQGKGYVMQSIFRRVDADVYVLVDGDATYPPAAVHALMAPVIIGDADMVVGSRLHANSQSDFKPFNRWANRFVLFILRVTFGVRFTDVLSGYRAFSRSFVKSLPLFGGGFEVETELTIKAVTGGYRIIELPVNLTARVAGSESKIQVFRDGMLILVTILALFRDHKPLTFFGSLGLVLVAAALIPGVPVARELIQTGSVSELPSAVLAIALALLGILLGTVGIILHSIARRSQELEHRLRMFGDEIRRERHDSGISAQ
jgi:glycosyltransferase involved in cell wall biosynthesis